MSVPPRCFHRYLARKQQQLQVLQIPVTAAGENILFITKMFLLLRSLSLLNKMSVPPWCFHRCLARKQQQLQVLQIPVTAAGENILFITKMFLLLRSLSLLNKMSVPPRCFHRCLARKQQQLQVLQIPVTAAGENISFITKKFWSLRSLNSSVFFVVFVSFRTLLY